MCREHGYSYKPILDLLKPISVFGRVFNVEDLVMAIQVTQYHQLNGTEADLTDLSHNLLLTEG